MIAMPMPCVGLGLVEREVQFAPNRSSREALEAVVFSKSFAPELRH